MVKKITKRCEEEKIEEEIALVLQNMQETRQDSEEYGIYLDRYNSLIDIRDKEKRVWIKKEYLPVIANLLGIALILYHEQANVVTSKALNFVTKGRV